MRFLRHRSGVQWRGSLLRSRQVPLDTRAKPQEDAPFHATQVSSTPNQDEPSLSFALLVISAVAFLFPGGEDVGLPPSVGRPWLCTYAKQSGTNGSFR